MQADHLLDCVDFSFVSFYMNYNRFSEEIKGKMGSGCKIYVSYIHVSHVLIPMKWYPTPQEVETQLTCLKCCLECWLTTTFDDKHMKQWYMWPGTSKYMLVTWNLNNDLYSHSWSGVMLFALDLMFCQ